MCSAQIMSGPCPVFAATAAFGRMSSCHSLSTLTSTPVALENASMLARVAASSASRNLLQRKSLSRAPPSGLKGCSWAQAAAHSDGPGASATPAASAPVVRTWRRLSWRRSFMRFPPLWLCAAATRDAGPVRVKAVAPRARREEGASCVAPSSRGAYGARGILRGREGQAAGMPNDPGWERFAAEGVDGLLRDKTRPSRIAPFGPEVGERIVALTLTESLGEITHWTGRAMAKAAGVSLSYVQRIWRSHELQPHRIRTFKLSNDPAFAAKVRDIFGLYVNPPAHAVVLSIDEKSQIQALDCTQCMRPSALESALASMKGQRLDSAFEILDVGNPIPFAPRVPSFLRFSFEGCRYPPKQRRLDAVVERADANYRANTVTYSRGAEVQPNSEQEGGACRPEP